MRASGLLVLLLAISGCAGDPVDEGRRGGLGKADLAGSCAGSDCGGASADGCYCDDACEGYGDCCADRAVVCGGGLTVGTYNVGLAHGAVPYADERLAPLVAAIAQASEDVLCLEEVWLDADAEAIQTGVKDRYPYAFRQVTESDSSTWFGCGAPQWASLYSLNGCVSEKCTPQGISIFECAKHTCAAEYNALTDGCKLCLAANTTSPLRCAAWRAPLYANEGRNGLMLLSRRPLVEAAYTAFDTYVIKRGVVRADVGGFQVQCTHMTPDLEMVPYPAEGPYGSWEGEHRAQVELLARQAGDRCTLLLGDLNAGPASPGIDAELGANFQAVLDAGYRDAWTSNQTCTYCADNPLVCAQPGGACSALSSRIDHLLFRGCAASLGADYGRTFTQPITITDEQGAPRETRLSDHYGLTATLR